MSMPASSCARSSSNMRDRPSEAASRPDASGARSGRAVSAPRTIVASRWSGSTSDSPNSRTMTSKVQRSPRCEANFMIAIEATIVSTAMPQIVGQLGGLQLYSWVFSAFLLTQTATTVVFGKLSDLIGRKTVILIGIAIFLVGSILCGCAWSMPSLIAFRLVQGVGAGAVQPVAMTIVGDLYSAHERAKVQGWLASVWALSAVLGPLAGGLIIQHFSWAWIFWMNLPIGALATAGFWAYLHEKRARRGGRIDHLSASVFTNRHRRDHGRSDRAFDLWPVRDRAHHRCGGGRGRAVRDPGTPVSRADDLARALGPEADRRGQRRFAAFRHGDDR